LLADEDGDVRSAAAVRIGELLNDPDVGLPNRREVFDKLRERDAEHPGIADAFWATVAYEDPLGESFDDAALRGWVIAVLEARRDRRYPLSPCPGNNLEFYAHELLERDADGLGRLLLAGYDDVVASALDHGALAATETIALLRALHTRTQNLNYAEALAIGYAVVLEEARSRWPAVRLAGSGALVITRDHARRRLWTVSWLIFDAPAASVASCTDSALLSALVEAGLPLDPYEVRLDPSAIAHITFPQLVGTTRQTRRPRDDLQVDLAITSRREVAVLRVVRARHPAR
jgi:hypothetical protein